MLEQYKQMHQYDDALTLPRVLQRMVYLFLFGRTDLVLQRTVYRFLLGR